MKLSAIFFFGASGCSVKLSRFIPPWERDGKTADAFFSGILKRKNPLQHYRKEKLRSEAQAAERAYSSALTPEEEHRIEEGCRTMEEKRKKFQEFLPYGAYPKVFFESTKMAAWGEYRNGLGITGSPSGLSSSHSSPLTRCQQEKTHNSAQGRDANADGNDRPILQQPNPFYSTEMNAILQCDLEEKIPYRYESCPLQRKGNIPVWPFHGTAGIVIDIDGVIYRSKKIIPGSDEAIHAMRNLRIPFVFMTNGGGVSEEEKAEELSSLLHCDIEPDQIILAHSPMRLLAPLYRHRNVLIVGSRRSEEVARSYGFTNPISMERFQCDHPELVPYKNWDASLPKVEGKIIPFPSISAVLSFSDMVDVMSDVQVILDVLLSPFGQVGTAVSAQQTIPYYQCADDLLWATEAELPRLGGGAMREMLSAVMRSVTGENLHAIMYGKPRCVAYAYAERQLKYYAEKIGWDSANMKSIFMVGDNLETDILGANAMGGLWTSVHVLSGIGSAPSAARTCIEGDKEQSWLERNSAFNLPHYVAPTLDHFFRELLAFPEEAMQSLRTPYFGEPNPVDLKELYNFDE